jgi:hypothetical protein
MLLGILTLITALCISAVAIYYSVAGLVAIFAAAALPIMIMGGTLEIAKLVTAVWLHRYWKQATWWLKSYLSVAVVVLMLITSMGIFGFLSKAHIEQTSASVDNVARVETLQSEIDRNLAIVGRAENRIRQLESSEVGADANIQTQIDREQERIDKAFERIQPAIQEQNTIIAGVTQLFQNELDKIDAELETLQGYVDNGEVKKAQQMIGASADGIFGKNTAEKIGEWKEAKQAEREEWLTKIQSAANSPTVVAARNEIQRLRKSAEDQVAQSQTLITRLQQQLANSDNAEEVQKSIDEQNERVRTASKEIDQLTEEKISLESEYRKLEAEVGPIKYIAEFVYGESADNNMLEEAVRWVIIIIIFVFDPLAVLLLIASQYTFEFHRKRKDDNGERLRLERQEYERARAQRIVDNPGFTLDDSVPPDNSTEDKHEDRKETTREEQQDAEELLTRQDEESIPPEDGHDPDVAETSQKERSVEDVAKDYIRTDDDLGDDVSKDDTTDPDASDPTVEQFEVQTDDDTKREIADSYILDESKKKNPLNLETQDTLSDAETQSQELQIQKAKNTSIPDTRNRFYYKEELEDAQQYIMKEKGKQVTKETKPETSEGESKTGYIQNAEQTNESLWKNIQKKTPE